MALSAADLQKRHELEGAPDPFPSLLQPTSAQSRAPHVSTSTLDTTDEAAFPSLASAAPTTTSTSVWGSATGPRIKPIVAKAPVFTDSFTLSSIDLSNAGKDGKSATLGEVIKQVIAKYKVKIEASANQKALQTTFHVKAESQKELDKAKRSLLALLSPTVTLVINAPASTIGSIIGPKGATLKQIRDQTSVRVDIPKRETTTIPNGNDHLNEGQTTSSTHDDDDEEPTIPVTLTGPQPLAYEAQAMLNQIISSKTSKITQRVRNIPAHILPFVVARRALFMAAANNDNDDVAVSPGDSALFKAPATDGTITLALNFDAREVTVSGDREAVIRVVEKIKRTIETFESSLTSVKISLPKRQHRLLSGPNAEVVMSKSNCSVLVSKADEPSDDVIVWGQTSDLPAGLSAVMEQANSKYIRELILPGPVDLSKQLATYMNRTQYAKKVKATHPSVEVFLPSPDTQSQTLSIDLVGDKSAVDVVLKETSELIGKLVGATRDVHIDWLLHRGMSGKNKKLKQFHEAHNVLLFFPIESSESSQVLLVYDPLSPAASVSLDEKKKHLDDVETEILKLDAADMKTEVVSVEKRWHEAVVGKGGTTLNAIIGEDTTLSIKVGDKCTDSTSQDIIVVRGVSADVDRAVKGILKIVEDAKNDEIDNSHSTEFDIDKEYVSRVVGAHGAGINRLRDQLGVKVDVSDDVDERERESNKKRKVVHQKSRVKITGRKENVEEAKKRIQAQVERLADETSEILKIAAQYHSSLIGQNGKYAIRLEEKYSVKITFPRQSTENGEAKTREQLKPDEVLIKGGKKGVANAKSELLDAVEFEKESNNVLKFTVPTRSVARILGKGGASINEIKDNTNAQIDVDKSEDSGTTTHITVRGTKEAVAAAKTAILQISEQVTDEITTSVVIESKFHRSIIGAGGQGLKELISRCGGPSESKLQAGLIKFPRQGEVSTDEVRLRGDAKLVAKLKAELEKMVAALRDRIILAVEIPAAHHGALIGRGGQNLNDMQNKYNVQIQIPGSRSYNQVGEPENLSDFAGVDVSNLVKVSGPRVACEKVITELKSNVKSHGAEGGVTSTISVPLKYHHSISQQGNFFKTLRSFGVHVDQSVQPSQSAIPVREPSARIDDTSAEASGVEWELVLNNQNSEEGDSIWTLKGRDQASLDRAEILIKEAIENAARMSHVGFLTLADRSMFPRIVGTKGANVSRLRFETGADITVSRENNTIVIIGAENEVITAKDAILRMTSNSGRSRRHE